jgi:hypothetical protein
MVHFTCDLCGRDVDRQRFVVKMEAFAASQSEALTEDDLEDSNLEAVAEILRDMEDGLPCTLPAPTRHWRFDLCPDCHGRFSRDPLSKGKLALSKK